jgi:glucose-1-phosphate thymidylyltransferase
MKIIVPMAGMGKRMRPHTLTTPKPLLPIAGKPIVQRLIEDIAIVCGEKIEEVAFIIGDFGPEAEQNLINIATNIGAKGSIHYQKEALGTAHAILCAKEALDGNVVVAFADTLFKANFKIDATKEGIIWVSKIEDPSAFGVVKLNAQNVITDFVEKPQTYVSDLAIIGIYYFKDGKNLRAELQYLIDNNCIDKGEYQLTRALENMKQKGMQFVPGSVDEWLDCGNKDATVYTNQRVLELTKNDKRPEASGSRSNSIVIEPCFIGENVNLLNAIIGPHVSVGNGSKISNSIVKNSIVQSNTVLEKALVENSIIGNYVQYTGSFRELSLGDYSTEK